MGVRVMVLVKCDQSRMLESWFWDQRAKNIRLCSGPIIVEFHAIKLQNPGSRVTLSTVQSQDVKWADVGGRPARYSNRERIAKRNKSQNLNIRISHKITRVSYKYSITSLLGSDEMLPQE